MSERFTKSIVEQAVLTWLQNMGRLASAGLEIALGEVRASDAEWIVGRCA